MKKKIILIITLIATVFILVAIGASANETESPLRYGRTTASGNVAYVYDLIKDGVMAEEPAERIEFDKDKHLTLEELRIGYQLFSSDHPECFWLGTKYRHARNEDTGDVLAMEPEYSFTGEELTAARSAVRSAIDEILEDLPRGSNYEKALYLHDTVAKITEYKMVGQHQTVYGVLVANEAVCAGYAATYQLLLNEAGIPAWTVSGYSFDPTTGESVAHAWNVVWIDEGVCVYTDVTWDDQGDDLYHSYFNLEKDDMAKDHIVNSEVFTLPQCGHTDEGYFQKNGNILTYETSVKEAAAMFDTTKLDERTAEFLYVGAGTFSDWMNENFRDLYFELGGKSSPSATYRFSTLGGEIHVSLVGDLPIMTHSVSIYRGENMTAAGIEMQNVTVGDSISEIIYTADDGYYFSTDYPTFNESGVIVERLGYTQIRIYGTPESSLSIELSPCLKRLKLDTPTASFAAYDYSAGILSGLSASAIYSIDGGMSWQTAGAEAIDISDNVKAEFGILIKNAGDGFTNYDSDVQEIRIEKSAAPSYSAISSPATASGNDGKISGVSPLMEYKHESGDWIECNSDELTDLAPGTYYLRIRADGNKLASSHITVTVGSADDIAVSGVKLRVDSELKMGTSYTALCEFTPSEPTNKTVYFSVSDDTVLTIDTLSGEITLKGRGNAKIRVTSQDGGLCDEIDVTVICKHSTKPDTTPLPDCRGDEEYFACEICGQKFDKEMNEISEIPTRHLYKETKHNDTHHWNECTCGEKINEREHYFGEYEESKDENGEEILVRVCSTCKYAEYSEKSSSFFDKAIDFLKNNTIFIVIGAATVVCVILLITILKKKK